MPHIFTGCSVEEAITKSIGKSRSQKNSRQTKGRVQVYAPPLFVWGHWVEIYAQFGITGPGSDRHVTNVLVEFDIDKNETPSAFGVEIEGGDRFITAIGPGSVVVTIRGNVATALRLRARSFTLALNITIDAN